MDDNDKPESSPASQPLQPTQNTCPNTDPPPSTTDNGTNKRKSDDDEDGPDKAIIVQIPQPIQKRQRAALIDDPAAMVFLRELGLGHQFFEDGKVLAWGLNNGDPDFLRIQKYVARGEGLGYGVKIQAILRIIPSVHTLAQDPDSYLDFKDDPKVVGMKRMMLWHGTKRHNVKSILEDGLRLPSYGGWYGFGIYFGDMVSTSCQYTDHSTWDSVPLEGKVGYLFLNDVLLGNAYNAWELKTNWRQPPPMYVSPWWKIWGQQQYVPRQSVKGTSIVGGYGPSSLGDVTIDGCTWPLGFPWGLDPIENEYIIYDTKFVKPKFLVKFEYTKKYLYVV